MHTRSAGKIRAQETWRSKEKLKMQQNIQGRTVKETLW